MLTFSPAASTRSSWLWSSGNSNGMAGSPTLSSAVHRSRYVGEANASFIVICDPGAVGPRKSSSSTDRNDLGASTGEPRTTVRIIWTMSAGLGRGALATPGWCPPDDGLVEDLRDWFRGELPIGFSLLGLLPEGSVAARGTDLVGYYSGGI